MKQNMLKIVTCINKVKKKTCVYNDTFDWYGLLWMICVDSCNYLFTMGSIIKEKSGFICIYF